MDAHGTKLRDIALVTSTIVMHQGKHPICRLKRMPAAVEGDADASAARRQQPLNRRNIDTVPLCAPCTADDAERRSGFVSRSAGARQHACEGHAQLGLKTM
eukprot:TRINITY_DN1524_c2_g1_i1.p1 TRINITY_DN1524_c2_g1~~TRINITY_DN1524_c2_g1_i1.p1  ORF type:complete len:101 (-),score=4.89 TRINITY_DN1524_c2_g1_i1:106-408(-)